MTELSSRFVQAVELALQWHGGQRRKVSGGPYVAHLLRVAAIVLEHGADEDEAIAALLHDAVEDQGGAAAGEEIRRRFGDRVAAIVSGCSDTDQTPKPPWRARKEAHVAQLAAAPASVRLVVAADKLDNARALLDDRLALGESVWGHFRGGREGTLWYYRAVVAALEKAGSNALVEQLDRVVGQLAEAAGRR